MILFDKNEYAKIHYALARQQYCECATKIEEKTQSSFLTHSKFATHALVYAKQHNYEYDEDEFLHHLFGNFQESDFIW